MRPASKVLRWILGAVVRRLTRGKYILCESRGQRALNGSVFLSNGIPQRHFYVSYGVCFVMVTVRPGYSRLRKAELELGLNWGGALWCLL